MSELLQKSPQSGSADSESCVGGTLVIVFFLEDAHDDVVCDVFQGTMNVKIDGAGSIPTT